MKFAIAVILSAMLCACGAMPPSEKKELSGNAEKWVGRTVDELIVAKGVPANVYPSESGGRIFEYFEGEAHNPDWAREHVKKYSHKRRFEGLLPNTEIPLYRADKPLAAVRAAPPASLSSQKQDRTASESTQPCKIIFTISASDIVEGWSIEGDGCN